MGGSLSIFENSFARKMSNSPRVVGDTAFALFFFAKVFSSWPPELEILSVIIQAATASLLALLILSKIETARSLAALYVLSLVLSLHAALFAGAGFTGTLVQLCIAATLGCQLFFNGLSKRCARIIFWTAVFAICILMAESPDGYYLFPQVLSRNYASVFMLMAYVCLASSREPVPELEMLVSAMACFFASIYCVGRGGILATALLVVLALIAFLRLFPVRIRRSASIILLVAGVAALVFLAIIMGDEFLGRFSLERTASSSNANRLSMLKSYFDYAFSNPLHLLLGFDPLVTGNSQILKHAGNVHNSFLQVHSQFGLIFLVLLVFSAVRAVRSSLAAKQLYLAAALAAFFARALFDKLFPVSYADFVVFLTVMLACERLFATRGLFSRDALGGHVPAHHLRRPNRQAFTACTPLQLFIAIQVRNQVRSAGGAPADLFIFDEFKGARDAAQTLKGSDLFECIHLIPSDIPTGRAPMLRTYFKQVFFAERSEQEFRIDFPIGEKVYTELFCANPRTIIGLKRFASSADARVNLLFEGSGSYAGTIASYFTIKNCAVASQHRSRLPKQVAKQDLKEILECLDTHGFFYSPVSMYIINDLPELHEMYPKMELVPIRFDLSCISKLGGYFSIQDPGLYMGHKVFFLGSYDELAPSELQVGLARDAARILGEEVVFRAHPRNPECAIGEGPVIPDTTGNLWELICCNGLISRNAVLIGFASTAQFLPKQLLDSEPCIVLLHKLFEPGIVRDRLQLAAEQVHGTYADSSRVIMPETIEEYHECLEAIRTSSDSGYAERRGA